MKFARLASLFAVVALAVLALGFTSAQVPDGCITPGAVSFPSSASNSQGTFPFSVVLNYDVAQCSTNRVITSVNMNSSIAGNPVGSWSISNNLPVTLNDTSNTITLSGVFNIPSSASGSLASSVAIVTQGTGTYNFALPSVTITQTSSSTISISTTQPQPVSVFGNLTLSVSNSIGTLPTVTMSETSGFGMIFNPSILTNLGTNAQEVNARFTNPSNIKFGTHTVSIKADASSQSKVQNFDVRKTFCSAGTVQGNLTINEVNWENNGEGDEDSWELLDELEVEVEIKNNNNDDDVDVVVELGLFDSSGNNVADDLFFTAESDGNDEEIEVNIDDDDKETVKWVFRVPADFNPGDYKLAVKAYDDNGQNRDCDDNASQFDNSFFQSIKVEETSDEGRFVVVDDIQLDTQVSCGETASGEFTVYNIGEDDQERTRIVIRNQNLGINIVREITSDLDQGEDETLDFSFAVPATARNGNYVLEFITEYDYKNGVYREESESSFDASFEVIGCSTQNTGNNNGGLTNIKIDADLASDAKAGEELVIVATITNTGNEDAEYSISARGYSSWADLTDISPGTISVDAGESKEVTLKMLVNKDASGTQAFEMQVSEGSRVQIQEIEVELSSSSSGIFSSNNSLIWIIGAVNLLLIILIIVVAVRMSRR